MLRSAWLLTGGDWALAEDLVQTALGQTWRRWDRVAEMDAPGAYAHKAMVNAFLSWRRLRWTGEIATAEIPEPGSDTGGFRRVDMRDSLRRALGELTAAATLQAAGFPVTMIAQPAPKSGGPVPAGEVWSQTPAAGTALSTGTVITLFYEPDS
jgi:hypothetical protein